MEVFADRFKRFNFSPDDIKAIRDAKRGTIRDAIGPHGGDRKSESVRDNQADNVSLKSHGNSQSYTIRRLLRDEPDLEDNT